MSRRKVFLDIGAHWGETLDEVLAPPWTFDLVYAFEPDPEAIAIIRGKFPDALAQGRLVIVEAALSNRDGEAELFGGNEGGGATLYAEKIGIDAARRKTVPLMTSRRFFTENLNESDLIVAKLNCEGGEIDILSDLADSGEIAKLAHAIVDFDIRKVRGRRREAKAVMQRMRAAGFNRFALTEDVMVGPDARARTRNALLASPVARDICADSALLNTPPRRPKFTRRLKTLFRYA